MSIRDSFLATVRFLTFEEGGRRRAPLNPATSQLALSAVQVSCYLVAIDEAGCPLKIGELSLGHTYRVRVVVDHARHYASDLADIGPDVEFFEGPQLVAYGVTEESGHLENTPDAIERFIRRPET